MPRNCAKRPLRASSAIASQNSRPGASRLDISRTCSSSCAMLKAIGNRFPTNQRRPTVATATKNMRPLRAMPYYFGNILIAAHAADGNRNSRYVACCARPGSINPLIYGARNMLFTKPDEQSTGVSRPLCKTWERWVIYQELKMRFPIILICTTGFRKSDRSIKLLLNNNFSNFSTFPASTTETTVFVFTYYPFS